MPTSWHCRASMVDLQHSQSIDARVAPLTIMTLCNRTPSAQSSPANSAFDDNIDDDAPPDPDIRPLKAIPLEKLPSLLALPVEIKMQIFTHLASSYLALKVLRRTHRSFRALIPKLRRIQYVSADDYRAYLLAAERTSSSLFPPNLYPCHSCSKVLPAEYFCDQSIVGEYDIGQARGHDRFCIDCGFRKNRYYPRQVIMIDGINHTVCWRCTGRLAEKYDWVRGLCWCCYTHLNEKCEDAGNGV